MRGFYRTVEFAVGLSDYTWKAVSIEVIDKHLGRLMDEKRVIAEAAKKVETFEFPQGVSFYQLLHIESPEDVTDRC